MDVQEYRKLAVAIKQRDLTLPQNGIKFKFGDFTCEQGRDASGAQCLWARDTAAEITCISDFIAIYQSDNTIRDASMPADRIWELIEHFPLKEECVDVDGAVALESVAKKEEPIDVHSIKVESIPRIEPIKADPAVEPTNSQ